ncbi:hypothetical protein NDU88_003247 [Pleurodeles waltl]|uniref:Uncharacterized protein n=1 Tax=Pleurodeles waltl TaxID=8319 RepID=A0AAV7QED6_PLEWA|nr:hypothetical protein NDU88_003247 [Pleurodeles waltl]
MQRACLWCAEGTPKASLSAPVRAWTAPSATPLVHETPAPPDAATLPTNSAPSIPATSQQAPSPHQGTPTDASHAAPADSPVTKQRNQQRPKLTTSTAYSSTPVPHASTPSSSGTCSTPPPQI